VYYLTSKPLLSHQDPPSTPPSILRHPAEVVAPKIIGCLLVKRQASGEPLWSVVKDFKLPVTVRKVWLGCFASRLHCG